MSAIEKLVDEDGIAFVVFPNGLSTVSIVAIKRDQWEPFQDFIEVLPEDQVIDISDKLSGSAVEDGVAKLRRKLRREGEYADWDERMRRLGLQD